MFDKRMAISSAPDQLDTTPVREAKVVFLGDSGADKSYIVGRLVNDGTLLNWDGGWADAESGIVIKDQQFDIGGNRVLLHFWDFGAQEIIHSVYRVFMTRRTVYVVVLDTRHEALNEHARKWLYTIKNFAPGSPVLLVLNYADQNPYASVSELDLRSIYPNLMRVVNMSALHDSQEVFNQTFTTALLEAVGKMDDIEFICPPEWMEVRQRLAVLSERYIQMNAFRDICTECHASAAEKMLQWLHDVGAVTWISGKANLENYIVLHPDWINTLICRILSDNCPSTENGIASYSAIHQYLVAFGMKGNSDETLYLLDILQRFYLLVRTRSNQVFIPALCTRIATSREMKFATNPGTLELRMAFEYLPDHIINLLMTVLGSDLDDTKTGIGFAYFSPPETNLRALIMQSGNMLLLYARSDSSAYQPSIYLGAIHATLLSIIRHIGLEQPETRIVLRGEKRQDIFHYEMLLGALENGEKTVYARSRRQTVRIEDLLGQTAWAIERQNEALLNDMKVIFTEIQQDVSVRSATEHIRNSMLQIRLRNRGYILADQSRLDVGRSRHDEVELMIVDQNQQPWAVGNTISVYNNSESCTALWAKTIERIVINPDASKLNSHFLICYVNGSNIGFEGILQKCRLYIHTIAPRYCTVVEGSFKELIHDWGLLYAAKCVYDKGGLPVTVYHYFIRTDDQEHPLEIPEDRMAHRTPPGSKPQQKTEPAPRQKQEQIASEYRVVFLGDGEAGKSLILARLANPSMDPKLFSGDMTPGIDIKTKLYTIGDRTVQVNFWDFGGQEILYSMHRMFLTKQTLYIVVVNTRQDSQDDRARFWLRYLRAFAPDAPVLLVLNKIDQNPGASVNQGQLRRINPMLKQILRLSAREYTAEQFEKALLAPLRLQISADGDSVYTFSDAEIRVRDELRKLSEQERRISVKRFRELCRDAQLTEESSQYDLLFRFHSTGVCVHFDKEIGTQTHMLLDPKWITGAIYRILKHRMKDTGNGIISHKALMKLLDDGSGAEYENEDMLYVLEVMRSFCLSYELPGRQTEFIPMLCRREESPAAAQIAQTAGVMELRVRFEYLPAGVLFQLMVECRDDLDKENVWLTGAIFQNQTGCRAAVCQEGDTLILYIQGREQIYAMRYLESLLDWIKKIAKDPMHTACIIEAMLSFSVDGKLEYFDYDRLMAAKQCGEKYVVSKYRKARIAVQDIFEQRDCSTERERDKLLSQIALACIDLQTMGSFVNHLEDIRNSQLRNALKTAGYDVADQTLAGEGTSGNRPNELDLLIRHPNGDPWMILEALNVSTKTSKTYWDDHLNKLVGRYNVWGLQTLVLISYVDCGELEFSGLYEKFDTHMRTYEPESAKICKETYEVFEPFAEKKSRFCAARCLYERDGQPTTVYHYFVHVGKTVPRDQTDDDM